MGSGGLTFLLSSSTKHQASAMVATPNGNFRGSLLGEPQVSGSTENVMGFDSSSGLGLGLACAGAGGTRNGGGGGGGMTRCQSVYSIATPNTAALSSIALAHQASSVTSAALPHAVTALAEPSSRSFNADVQRHLDSTHYPDANAAVFVDRKFREVMEFHLSKARLRREKARNRTHLQVHAAIASSVGVPYSIRSERPFLFDSDTHPLHTELASAIGVDDLTQLHRRKADAHTLFKPLTTPQGRGAFQACYDGFVTSFCIPLLHSLAMSKNLFHSTTAGASPKITYRYQAFPNIRIRQPGDEAVEPTCDTSEGHSIGYLRFHVPLTPAAGTNALYTESHPGREDWHPLVTKSVGLGYLFDGARCLHFDVAPAASAATAVSLEFRIAIYREGERIPLITSNTLSSKALLEDSFTRSGPDFYDEAVIGVGLGSPSWQIVAKKHGDHLLDPDYRVGAPF